MESTETIFDTLGTDPGNGNLIFISDGEDDISNLDINNPNGEQDAENNVLIRLRNSGVNVSAFGAGEDASIDNLKVIDSGAESFDTADELLIAFGDLNSDASGNGAVDGGGSQSALEEVVPGVTIYIDLNENGTLDDDEPTQITNENGEYIFEDLAAGTYTVLEVTPDGFTSTTGEQIVTIGEGESIEDIDFGNISDEELAMLNTESDM